jgi:hypothetical protein
VENQHQSNIEPKTVSSIINHNFHSYPTQATAAILATSHLLSAICASTLSHDKEKKAPEVFASGYDAEQLIRYV